MQVAAHIGAAAEDDGWGNFDLEGSQSATAPWNKSVIRDLPSQLWQPSQSERKLVGQFIVTDGDADIPRGSLTYLIVYIRVCVVT